MVKSKKVKVLHRYILTVTVFRLRWVSIKEMCLKYDSFKAI